ncbi:biofilm PGA synthesis lipoPgaB domain protein [Acinetobacter baumannii 472237-1196]|nr:biofilm PGA synthesis lipoPgaB domain protein [Acinetobacter baumannii 472237-1196]
MITRFASPLLNLTLGLALAGLSGMALANPPKIDASTLTVIGYHEITDTKNALIPQYAVTTQQFTEHVDWLQKNGFHFITVDQLIRAHQGKAALPTKPVLLTVDDGYQSFYQNAYPVIKAKKNPSGTCGSGFMVRAKSRAESRFFG